MIDYGMSSSSLEKDISIGQHKIEDNGIFLIYFRDMTRMYFCYFAETFPVSVFPLVYTSLPFPFWGPCSSRFFCFPPSHPPTGRPPFFPSSFSRLSFPPLPPFLWLFLLDPLMPPSFLFSPLRLCCWPASFSLRPAPAVLSSCFSYLPLPSWLFFLFCSPVLAHHLLVWPRSPLVPLCLLLLPPALSCLPIFCPPSFLLCLRFPGSSVPPAGPRRRATPPWRCPPCLPSHCAVPFSFPAPTPLICFSRHRAWLAPLAHPNCLLVSPVTPYLDRCQDSTQTFHAVHLSPINPGYQTPPCSIHPQAHCTFTNSPLYRKQ